MTKKKESPALEATTYVKKGVMVVLRTALPLQDPESWPSLWKAKYGNLDGFPWVETFGREPTPVELVRAGFKQCPTCHQPLTKEPKNKDEKIQNPSN